jgi:hypothetical protein
MELMHLRGLLLLLLLVRHEVAVCYSVVAIHIHLAGHFCVGTLAAIVANTAARVALLTVV